MEFKLKYNNVENVGIKSYKITKKKIMLSNNELHN
jgi:hypothetical protein